MYTIDDIEVKLLNENEIRSFIKNHGQIACVCYNTDEKYSEKVGLKCMESGHMSGSRGDFFKFEITAPRFTQDQIMRHEVGVFKNCQSQRYVDMDDNFSIYVPPYVMKDDYLMYRYERYEIMCKAEYKVNRDAFNKLGITGEKANDLMRTMLPIGVKSTIRIGFTLEGLINFMEKRLCVRADAPIQRVAQLMRDLVVEVEPRYKDLLVPQCKRLLYCPEGDEGCGGVISREELIEIKKMYNKNKDE